MRALFTGSFDPVTNGHLDLIRRIVPLVDSLVLAIAVNIEKSPLFTDEERVDMLREACREWPKVEVCSYDGLVVNAARELNADLILRGIRNTTELEREMQMAHANRALAGVETLLLPASPEWTFLSSSLVREVARFGGDISSFVPASVARRFQK